MKKTMMIRTIKPILSVAAAFALAACSSTRETAQPLGETTRATAYKEGVPGGVIIETTRLNATVAAIDAAKREVTLSVKDGRKEIIGCGPEVINFDQIRVGDHVEAVIKAELVISLAEADSKKNGAGVVAGSLAPKGEKPGGVMYGAQDYVATITAINQKRREVTLRLPDATTRTLVVRPDVDLTKRKVGEEVSVKVSVTVAIAVQGH